MRIGSVDLALPVSGFRGVRAYLPPCPLREIATRPAERIFRSSCTDEQWEVVQRHRVSLEHAQARQRSGCVLEHTTVGGAVQQEQVPTKRGQQVMRAYGSTRPPLPFPTVGRKREVKQESAQEWSYHHRPQEVGAITFDTSSMVPSPLCTPQGT